MGPGRVNPVGHDLEPVAAQTGRYRRADDLTAQRFGYPPTGGVAPVHGVHEPADVELLDRPADERDDRLFAVTVTVSLLLDLDAQLGHPHRPVPVQPATA